MTEVSMQILAAMALRSRFAPLPTQVHILFCILATVLFITLYLYQRKLKDLLWLLVCDLPLILQFYGDEVTALVVGVCEILLLVMIFLEYLKERKLSRESAPSGESVSGEDSKEASSDSGLSDLEKAVALERSKLAGKTDDIISQAFDGEEPGA